MASKLLKGRLCPACGSKALRIVRRPFSLKGTYLGDFEADECAHCGDYGFTAAGSKAVEKAAKAQGLWGTGGADIAPVAHPKHSKAHA
jgi:hypothetical protein